jgi:homopolymeric O-antigen transport system ATP-binding protein
MDEDSVFEVEHVSKKFCKSLTTSMKYALQDVGRHFFGFKNHSDRLRKKEFWAVNDVSFKLKKGESLGLIGHNGSGKTTLLQLMNGILAPDIGKISIRGSMGALIGVGAGFHPLLTGRENIYINGAILGLSQEKIDEKFEDIVKFADIGDFLDTPVKHYSSGMFVRLGFAISYQMDPDVLLIDEVLAVGDEKFQTKCFNAIEKIKETAAVVLVSHNLAMIQKMSTHVATLEHGHLKMYENDPKLAIKKYLDDYGRRRQRVLEEENCKITNLKILNPDLEGYYQIENKGGVIIEGDAEIPLLYKKLEMRVDFASQTHVHIAECNSTLNEVNILNKKGKFHFKIEMPDVGLTSGFYFIGVQILNYGTEDRLCWHDLFAKLKMNQKYMTTAPVQFRGKWNLTDL